MNPIFSPPLYMQRYQFVIDFVKRNKSKKVVDLGCNDCTLLKKLKFHREIELLSGVDIDSAAIKKKMYGLAPIPTDYLQPAEGPLTIELYQGSVTEKDARLKGFDLVTSIELIEHLQLTELKQFSEVVFGYMCPASVIISTPNAEFNPLLPGLKGFRHYDHKFEWTRAEFQSWAVGVCVEFGYEVEFTGVGQAPRGQQERVGFCSQIAVFQRRGRGGGHGCRVLPYDDADEPFSYTLLYSVAYPSLKDSNVLQRTLVNEVLYGAEWLRKGWMQERRSGEGDEDSTQTGGEETGPMERCRGGVAEEEEEMHQEERWTNGEGQPELYRQGRCVCVPLARLWVCCPRIEALSGSLQHLRQLVQDDPGVRLTQDGSAVILEDQDQDQEEEDEQDEDFNNNGQAYTLANQPSLSTGEDEDWEAEF